MQIRLKTRVEVDGATFWFGAADDELLAAIEILTLSAPVIAVNLLGQEFEEIAKMTEEEIIAQCEGRDPEPKHLPGGVHQAFCKLFVAAVEKWEGVTDEDDETMEWSPEHIAGFPTEKKVAVVCELFNERKRNQLKESAPSD